MKKIVLIILILTFSSTGSEVKKFFNPRTIIVDEIDKFFKNRAKLTNNIKLKSKVSYVFKDGKEFKFKKKFELSDKNTIKIKIYKFGIKIAEFYSDGEKAKLKRVFKDDRERLEENLNLSIFSKKRLDLPIKTNELIQIISSNIFTPLQSAKITQRNDSLLSISEDNIDFIINSNMEIEKIIIQDGRNTYIEYSDYRMIENSSYKIPFNVFLKTENFTMLINHQNAIIRNK